MPSTTSDTTPRESVFAWLTPPGAGAIAIVRLTGARVDAFCQAHLNPPPRPGRAAHVRFIGDDALIDDPVAIRSIDGMTIDLCVHAGPWIVGETGRILQADGFALLEGSPDQIPDPRLVDGRTMLDREVAAALPLTTTELAARTLLDQPRRWAEALRTGNGLLDWAANPGLGWLLNPPTVAVVGIPNAGKSTLVNALAGREHSIVADHPGTTRDWVDSTVVLGGAAIRLIDTPGRRATSDPIEAEAIRLSRQPLEDAELLVLVLDATVDTPDQRRLLGEHRSAVRVWNKSDHAAVWRSPPDAVPSIAKTGVGVGDVTDRIVCRLKLDLQSLAGPMVWTDRQRRILDLAEKDPVRIKQLWEPP